MKLISELEKIWAGSESPFLVNRGREITFSEIQSKFNSDLSIIKPGDIVAIIGDFDEISISNLIRLIDIGAIVVPITDTTHRDHKYFFETANVDYVIRGNIIEAINHSNQNKLIEELRILGHPGIVLFSTGTTGRPKAILHDLTFFFKKYNSSRPALRTLSFLLFDHIGGLNTLFHTLFNKGVIIVPEFRTVDSILSSCDHFKVELLPTTPTFLRMLLMSGTLPNRMPKSLKIITYGTERMDQTTLDKLCDLLPSIEFRQTYGMSEIGIVRVKSEGRKSLYMKIGGDGVETRIRNNVLQIRSKNCMIGYLNASSPFDLDGWYDTKDIVEVKGEYIKITGRLSEIINVAGLKFMPSEVEQIALRYTNVKFAKVISKQNPITGQHVEISIQLNTQGDFDENDFTKFLRNNLQAHMIPKRIRIENVEIGARFKIK